MAEASVVSQEKAGWFHSAVNNRYVTLAFRLILAGIFLLSSYGKLVDIERYSVDAVYNFGILPVEPVNIARFFGLVMPFVELLCALGLLFGVLTRLSALGVSLMSLAFFVSKGIVLSQGRSIECGCFGAVIDTLASVTIFMDIPMLLMGLLVMFSSSRHWLAIGGLIPEAWRKKLNLIW
jgi:uncharacterized membrane protein YphA (DoxX/SURF4 family)